MDPNANEIKPELAEMAKMAKTAEDLEELAQAEGNELAEAELEGIAGGYRCFKLHRQCDGYYCETYQR